ncbi:cation/H(+) antiporter [Streptomyces phaeolivaceus]|uniref:Cation/H(+) antiporter n=1 Tax=Streptomyces phaeolivaceus TaxID=2653200 RepID=A0A5P8K9B5_9ACTN|nr:cation:proton antiporter [Streptomyces phaeolivaceus]QFQ99388.1 cation/H(+) antiporter [Streptomyces phaeolivaceus]
MTPDSLPRFLVAVAVILLVSHLFGAVLRRLGQPSVLGEILGGLVLGPSLLGLCWPTATHWLFPSEVLNSLDKVAQLGLILFMFLIGCEVRTGHGKRQGPLGAVLVGGMGLPFVCGVGFALAAGSTLAGAGVQATEYALFMGLAFAVTAVPVLARILVDLGLDRTRAGGLSMTCAAVGDGLAWLVLTLILASTQAGGPGQITRTVVLVVALVALTFFGVRQLLAVLTARMRSEELLTAVLVVGAIGYAVLTDLLHLHPVVGAFLFGTVVPRGSPVIERIGRRLQSFTLLILLPLFFAGVGLKTSVGMFGTAPTTWLVFVAALFITQATKVVGAGGAAKLAGLPGREALQIGVLMNCRGVTELVIATIGFQAGLINELCFTMLVLIAVITTAVTGVVLPRLAPGDGPRDSGHAPPGGAVVARSDGSHSS